MDDLSEIVLANPFLSFHVHTWLNTLKKIIAALWLINSFSHVDNQGCVVAEPETLASDIISMWCLNFGFTSVPTASNKAKHKERLVASMYFLFIPQGGTRDTLVVHS